MGRRSIEKPSLLAGKLRYLRERSGLSQNQIIDAFGLRDTLSQAEISAFETGKRLPPLRVLLLYARFGSVSVEDLIDDEAKVV